MYLTTEAKMHLVGVRVGKSQNNVSRFAAPPSLVSDSFPPAAASAHTIIASHALAQRTTNQPPSPTPMSQLAELEGGRGALLWPFLGACNGRITANNDGCAAY